MSIDREETNPINNTWQGDIEREQRKLLGHEEASLAVSFTDCSTASSLKAPQRFIIGKETIYIVSLIIGLIGVF